MRQWRVGSLVSSCPRGTQTAHLISTFVDPRLPAAGEDFHRGADAAPCAREQGTWGVLQEVDTVAAERGPSGGQAVRMESEGGSDAGRSWWVARTRARGFRTRTRSRRSSRSPPPAPAAAAAVAIIPAPRRGTPQRAPRRTRAKAEAGAAHHLKAPDDSPAPHRPTRLRYTRPLFPLPPPRPRRRHPRCRIGAACWLENPCSLPPLSGVGACINATLKYRNLVTADAQS
jgi:hypothetical protein